MARPQEFDAELYLRLAGERELLAGDDDGPDTSPPPRTRWTAGS